MLYDFNFYSSLLLPAFLHGMLFALLFFVRSKKENNLSDQLMAWLLLINSLKVAYWMLGFAGWYDSHDAYTSFMFYFPFNNMVLVGPLLYFYFLSVTNHDFTFKKEHFPHVVLPVCWFLLILVKFIVDFSFYSPFQDIDITQYGTKGPYADLDKTVFFVLLGYISFGYYIWLTMKAFRDYKSYIGQNFSDDTEINFNWLRNLIYAFCTGVLIFFIFQLCTTFLLTGKTYMFEWYAYFGLGIVIYYLSIAGYFSHSKVQKRLHFDPSTMEKSPSIKEFPEIETWKSKLLTYMLEKRPYLDPELTLSDLAKALKTNVSVLSKVINDGTGQNFNDFINGYRVKTVISSLQEGKQKLQSLLGIAYDSGFNSKATFNRSFKKITGITPKEYLDGLKT